MQANDLEYGPLSKTLSKYAGKGRRESANYLNWFLENIYRMDAVSADDAICDESNDKGIDGIYVDRNSEEVHFFQSKVSQKPSSIGDASIKQFVASVQQFATSDNIRQILEGNANSELKKIITRTNLISLVDSGYSQKSVFISNAERDTNTVEIEKHFDDLTVYAASDIVSNFIEFDAAEGIKGEYAFDASYAGIIELITGGAVKVFLLPVSATELVGLEGISDGKLFSQNVRYALGNTPVNKAIAKSISDVTEHKNFSLYHNGVTLICRDARHDEDNKTLTVYNYVVVNGAQSITTFFHAKDKLTEDLRVFVKIISLDSEELGRKITINSNNQNSIKPRDLRSNHDLMLRLSAEFRDSKSGYQFEIKRGSQNDPSLKTISNEDAGRNLLAFDLDEPYSCHQIYRVFDDKYSDIFGRKEVTFGRIIFLDLLQEIVSEELDNLKNRTMAKYALTRYFLINVIGHIVRLFDNGREFLANTEKMNSKDAREEVLSICQQIAVGLIVDLNYEIEEVGDIFDYKKELKSPESVKDWRLKLLRTYEKDFLREKAPGFGVELAREID